MSVTCIGTGALRTIDYVQLTGGDPHGAVHAIGPMGLFDRATRLRQDALATLRESGLFHSLQAAHE
jgi:hypothetical protein